MFKFNLGTNFHKIIGVGFVFSLTVILSKSLILAIIFSVISFLVYAMKVNSLVINNETKTIILQKMIGDVDIIHYKNIKLITIKHQYRYQNPVKGYITLVCYDRELKFELMSNSRNNKLKEYLQDHIKVEINE